MMWLQAFHKRTDSQHPGAAIADAWKTSHKFKFVTIDEMENMLTNKTAVISTKLDGELVCIYYKDGKVETVTPKGTIRTGMPATDEAAKLLSEAGYKEAAFLGEIYAVDEEGRAQSYMKAASIIRDPEAEQDHLIRLAVFDIDNIDGKSYIEELIENKVRLITQTFGKGKYIHPAFTIVGDADEARNLWDQLEEKGWEGLIIYLEGEIYKVKPIMSYDMVVVAITKSDKFIGQIAAVLCSFLDKEGRFRLNGLVSGGLTDAEKAQLLDWAERNMVREDEDKIWVDPFKEPMIVEVEAAETNVKKRPVMEFKDGRWVQVEENWSGVLRFPHVKRFRDDKSPRYEDVPIEQLPVKSAYNRLSPGLWIKTVNGYIGKIISMVPNSGDSGLDYDIICEFDPPLFGYISIAECHPTEIMSVGESREELQRSKLNTLEPAQ